MCGAASVSFLDCGVEDWVGVHIHRPSLPWCLQPPGPQLSRRRGSCRPWVPCLSRFRARALSPGMLAVDLGLGLFLTLVLPAPPYCPLWFPASLVFPVRGHGCSVTLHVSWVLDHSLCLVGVALWPEVFGGDLSLPHAGSAHVPISLSLLWGQVPWRTHLVPTRAGWELRGPGSVLRV